MKPTMPVIYRLGGASETWTTLSRAADTLGVPGDDDVAAVRAMDELLRQVAADLAADVLRDGDMLLLTAGSPPRGYAAVLTTLRHAPTGKGLEAEALICHVAHAGSTQRGEHNVEVKWRRDDNRWAVVAVEIGAHRTALGLQDPYDPSEERGPWG